MSEEMIELAELCEKATGMDLDLDHAIGRALSSNGNYSYRPYTASLDAAMTLVPEGWRRWICDSDEWRCICRLERNHDGKEIGAQAATWPLALCAAALRCRSEKGGTING